MVFSEAPTTAPYDLPNGLYDAMSVAHQEGSCPEGTNDDLEHHDPGVSIPGVLLHPVSRTQWQFGCTVYHQRRG